jgi:hypothetical protein
MTNPIRSILNTHAAAGYREITAREKDLYQVYLAARERLEDRIREYVLSGRNSFTGPRLVALMEELQDHFAAFEERYRKTAKHAITWVAQSFYHSALVDLELNPPQTVGGLNRNTLQQMVEDDFAHIAGATRKMTATAVGNLRRISARVMREAAMTGETRRALSKRLFTENGGPSFLFRARDGRIWDSGAYFKMLGRTILHNNARETYLTACAENGSDLVTVSYSGAPCDACAHWEGRLLSITGESPYPTIETATADGLFHPNCTHRLVAVPPAIAQTKFDAQGRPNDQPAKPDAPVARNPVTDRFVGKNRQEVYAELDKTKDHELFIAYDASGNLLDVHESGPTGGKIPEHLKLPDLTFIHNHPRGWQPKKEGITAYGSSFSAADVMTAVNLNWKRIEAVTPRRVYILERPRKGWNVSLKELSDHIAQANQDVRQNFTARITKGRLTIEVAESLHHDMVWKRVAKACGFVYSKENRHVAR